MISSLNPPPPPVVKMETDEQELSSSSSSSNQKDPAHRLLKLIRFIEKEPPGEAYEAYMEETVELMNSFILLYSRRGLLQGNVSKAEKILSSVSQGRTEIHGRRKGSSSSNKQKSTQDNLFRSGVFETGNSDLSTQVSETLIFTALTRILAESEESRKGRADDSSLLLALGAELCLSIVWHCQVNKDTDHLCIASEFELLSMVSKSIFSGLVSRIHSIEDEIRRISGQQDGGSERSSLNCLSVTVCLDETRHVAPVLSCLRAACAMVRLFGTKLSRSTGLLVDLRRVAWSFITIPNVILQDAAGRLLASLPLAGGIDRKTPVEIWNSNFQDILYMMNSLLEAVAPVGNKTSIGERPMISDGSAGVLSDWISFLNKDISSGKDRATTLVTMMRGLVLAYQHCLSPDLGRDAMEAFLEVRIDVELILDIVERFVSYPMAAESLFFRTKNRLRDEVVEGGLISPRLVAVRVANEMKLLGHDVVDSLIKSVGGPALLPNAKRIIRIAYASLLTSCSRHVRKVMDPSSSGQLEGKKRRWLHLSLVLRSRTVTTVQTVLSAFGSDRTAKSGGVSESKADSKSYGEMAVTLVVGCLLEQMGAKDAEETLDETWSTIDERIALIIACLDCLCTVLSSVNGFLGVATRSMIDSIAVTCLTRNNVGSGCDPFLRSSVQRLVFRLSSTCLLTPWNDGDASALVGIVRKSSMKILKEGDEETSRAAMEALRVCDFFGTPRAPPLVFIRRSIGEHEEQFEALAPRTIADIQTCKADDKLARLAAEDKERTMRKEKRLQETEKEAHSKRQRVVEEASEKLVASMDNPSTPEIPQRNVPTEDTAISDGRTVQPRDEGEDKDVNDDPRDVSDGAEVEDTISEQVQSDYEDFPDIDNTADGPDSDDD